MTRLWLQPLVIALLLAPSLVTGLVAPATGQSVLLLDENASFCAMFQALSPTRPVCCQARARSIVFRPPTEADAAPVAPARVYMPLRPAFRLPGTPPGSPRRCIGSWTP
jgi:hypothetical protein